MVKTRINIALGSALVPGPEFASECWKYYDLEDHLCCDNLELNFIHAISLEQIEHISWAFNILIIPIVP